MKKKLVIGFLAIILVGIVGVWFFVFYKPTHFKRDVADEKAVVITAVELVKNYQSNETLANGNYLNKALEITGEIAETKLDPTGNTTVTLKTDDAFANVFVTFKDTTSSLTTGRTIVVKGICTGFLSDVVVIDAMLVK